MKSKTQTKLIAISIAAFLILTSSKEHEATVDFKIADLCAEHKDKDCKDIDNYCRESLERGFDCLIVE
jgi:hypothetical protein